MESPSENGAANGSPVAGVHEIRVTFTPDGNLELHAEGVGPPQFWAAAHLIALWGDSEFAASQVRAASANASPIVKPGDLPKGIRRLLG